MSAIDERRRAFEQLFAANYWPLRAYVTRRAQNASVDDVLADTFLVAWRRFNAVPPDAFPWLIAVARRTMANHLRAQRRRSALTDRLRTFAFEGMEWDPPGTLSGALGAALSSLPEREREALLLVAWEGLTPARAAEAASCSPAAFRVRLYRARRRVAAQLAGELSEAPRPRATKEAS